MKNRDKWSALSMQQRADLIKLYIDGGINSIKEMRKDYNGIPYRDLNTSEYDYFNAHPSNAPTKEGEHWTSRNPRTGQLLKREDHPTFDLMIEGEKQAGYNVVKGLDGNLYSIPNTPNNYVEDYNNFGDENKFATGGPTEEEGGYPRESINKREWAYEMYDPSGGLDFSAIAGRNYDGGARGEEDQYWRAYLGLRNDVPKMKPSSKTEWDDQIEAQKAKEGLLPSEFYGTTNAMDLMIQAMADTTTTGQIVRNYEAFKRLNPNLAPKKNIEAVYNSGKDMMDNPGKWTQVGETKENSQLDIDDRMIDNEQFPLGMLAAFGAKWIPEENTIHIHDTYDFPTFKRKVARIPDRPREMKIRGKVKYNPKNRAKIFNSENFNLIFPK